MHEFTCKLKKAQQLRKQFTWKIYAITSSALSLIDSEFIYVESSKWYDSLEECQQVARTYKSDLDYPDSWGLELRFYVRYVSFSEK